jgi:glycosyltransferase involved in cell wall biosynthesis
MDPYLEGSLWTSFHAAFGTEIARHLARKLLPRYVALPVERFFPDTTAGVTVMAGDIYPDVGVARNKVSEAAAAYTTTVDLPLRMATVMPEPVPHVSVEIREAKGRELVTAIEILSPTNKTGKGRAKYLSKREKLLLTPVHLIEIDLVRSGQRVPMREPLPSAPYFVFVSRAETRPVVEVWPVALADALPSIPVPLLRGDADIFLDLQAVVTAVYDDFRFGSVIDYSELPDVPFTGEAAEWVRARASRM